MSGVPYTFGTATTSIPLSNLDSNFVTPITIGNASVALGNTITSIGNLTLTNPTIIGGTSNVSSTSITNGTSNVSISSSGGNINVVTGGTIATFPQATGTVMVSGNMPAFSAYPSTTFTASSATWTKIPANTKEFDTNSNYDNATNYRFTPTVSGYYQISGCWSLASGTSTRSLCAIYKNGTLFKQGLDTPTTFTTGSNISTLINLNGSTDYVEFYLYIAGTGTQTVNAGAGSTWFQAVLVRAA